MTMPTPNTILQLNRLLSGTQAPLDAAFARALVELVRPTLAAPRRAKSK